ncbi:hypothetical protein A3J78_02175 [Candidatus Beckwithbacteria bacterium RBG_13_35_6]|uniref:DUF2177 domain-containing protein n=1 Tax=Candidatus Beckwithbacteria bacterium RBG_13_35_6 TaxID=1797456 RepID=A0A1F5DHD1_9BACT|nr:MAG: hypothetical protein A3J78_02175 [Candidatus Beckwithbacteria bacterium RBG_13_35_6]
MIKTSMEIDNLGFSLFFSFKKNLLVRQTIDFILNYQYLYCQVFGKISLMIYYLKLILLWFSSFIFTTIIDVVWHILFFGKIYLQELKPLTTRSNGEMVIKFSYAIFAQILVVLGIVFLILYKSKNINIYDAVLIGAVAGILAISVYGLVNFSLLKNWSLTLTVLEVIWGPILGALSGYFIYWLKSKIF